VKVVSPFTIVEPEVGRWRLIDWRRRNLWGFGVATRFGSKTIEFLSSNGFLLRRIEVTGLRGEDDQTCPFTTTGARSVKLLKKGTLKSHPGLPHGHLVMQ
jgi:hypothetical protein